MVNHPCSWKLCRLLCTGALVISPLIWLSWTSRIPITHLSFTTLSSGKSSVWVRRPYLNQRDGLFILRTGQLNPDELILFETVAGAILDEKEGTLAEQTLGFVTPPTRLPEFTPSLSPRSDSEPTPPLKFQTNYNSRTGLEDSTTTGRNTSSIFNPASIHRSHGPMSLLILSLVFWFPNQDPLTLGQKTVVRTA